MDERVWTDSALQPGEPISLGSVTIRAMGPPKAAYLISGNLEAALAQVSPTAPMLGLLEDRDGSKSCALRVSRDSALLLSDGVCEVTSAWHETDGGAFAISDASDVYAGFSISGEGADSILAQGGIGDVNARSASAAVQFGGVTTLLLRDGSDYCLWVPSALAIYMTSFFKGMAKP